jgi:CRISPR-associated endonuclease/helicase Cas3
MQKALAEALDRKNNPHPAILLKAPTGSGKTESILFPALANDYRLFLILPTRSLLEDQQKRIHKYLTQFSTLPQNKDRQISLVVDTGAQMERWLYVNGQAKKPNVQPWRHLYKGNVILTTLDKFLYRYFSFGGKQKSFIFPHRIHQGSCLFCFDEAHSYDDISFTNFQSLVKALYEAGRSLVLMTATMPPELAKRFDYLETIDYTTEFSQQPERRFEWKEHLVCNREEPGDFRNPDSFQKDFADIIVNEWKSRNQHSRIIAVAESVRDAAAIYQQLKDILGCDTTSENRWLFLYHGRIAEQLRPKLYQAIKQRDDEEQPYIVVTTSAIEVGCDLNAEVLVSQICPPENIIQRAGRCNRRGKIPDAKVIVVGDRIPDFANSLDEAGWQKYQETLRSLQRFDTQLISQCISRSQQVEDYRVVELFSMLHDYVYSADLTCQPLHKRGLIPTRSWQPSVTLVHLGKGHSISVPIDRLANGQKYADIYAYEKRYDKEKSQWDDEHLLGWGSAYGKEITVRISPDGIDVDLPRYDYDENLGFVEIPKIFVKKWTDGAEEKLLYITGQHKAVISYIKSLNE